MHHVETHMHVYECMYQHICVCLIPTQFSTCYLTFIKSLECLVAVLVYIRLCRHHLKTNQNTFPSFFFFFSLPFNTTVNWDIQMAMIFFVKWCENERESTFKSFHTKGPKFIFTWAWRFIGVQIFQWFPLYNPGTPMIDTKWIHLSHLGETLFVCL